MFMYAAVDSHKNGEEEARAEKGREEGGGRNGCEQPSSTQDQFSIWSAPPPPAPRPPGRSTGLEVFGKVG